MVLRNARRRRNKAAGVEPPGPGEPEVEEEPSHFRVLVVSKTFEGLDHSNRVDLVLQALQVGIEPILGPTHQPEVGDARSILLTSIPDCRLSTAGGGRRSLLRWARVGRRGAFRARWETALGA